MKNLYKDLDTETLIWMDYKYKHCDGQCDKCPNNDISYYCSYIHELEKKELERREK